MFGWTENFSTQGPEHCHIDFCKKVAKCTNNKDVFLMLLKFHVREGHLQYLECLYSDLADGDVSDKAVKRLEIYQALHDAVSCELGIRYPVLQSIMSGHNHQTIQVFLLT